jgi:hypothetical protein
MANSVRLESGWLLRQLESAEQRASNLPYWLTANNPPSRSEKPEARSRPERREDQETGD